jgi:hypothetical protein
LVAANAQAADLATFGNPTGPNYQQVNKTVQRTTSTLPLETAFHAKQPITLTDLAASPVPPIVASALSTQENVLCAHLSPLWLMEIVYASLEVYLTSILTSAKQRLIARQASSTKEITLALLAPVTATTAKRSLVFALVASHLTQFY